MRRDRLIVGVTSRVRVLESGLALGFRLFGTDPQVCVHKREGVHLALSNLLNALKRKYR